jgi:Zn-dependent protease with chaperone function
MNTIYPEGPASVPENLNMPTSAYKQRAWLAMGSLLLFVALYLFIAGWFVSTAFRLIAGAVTGGKDAFVGVFLGLCAAFLAVFMLKALFFVKHGGQSDDLEVTPAQQPRLFAFLHRLADEAGAPRPHRVFLSPRVNASVFYDLSLLNLIFPSKKNLEIGLGLVNVLTLGELKAVCAHEFGHFAQRTMAVGRWVYISQQVAAHIVAKRDILDRFMDGLSRVDLRIAWIGWVLRLIVWSIRSVVESMFSLVVVAQRALSRQMEMQADLLAVSLTGSDALIHGLHRTHAADDAWDRTLHFFGSELAKGRAPVDVFAIQTRVIERMRMLLQDPDYGRIPPMPARKPEAHRLFKAELAQPPKMWATHPQNHEREENAKRVYVPAPRDDRSAWELFDNARELRERISASLAGAEKVERIPAEDSLAALDAEFNREFLKPSYRGVYIDRSVTRGAERVEDLYSPLAEVSVADLDSFYPESLTADLARLRNYVKEKSLLELLRDGVFAAPGGVISHRGKELSPSELPRVITRLGNEIEALQSKVAEHDRRCRSVHRAVAARLHRGWEEYLVGLAALVHFADHSEANIRDARQLLQNRVAVVTAGGRVDARGIGRVLAAAFDLQQALEPVFSRSDQLRLDRALTRRLGGSTWSELLGKFELPDPNKENIDKWLGVADSWADHAIGALMHLKECALEELLNTEAWVARCFRAGGELGPAPAAGVPFRYPVLVQGTERKLETRLGWWARFMTADGTAPALARLAVACSIVGLVLGMGSKVGDATITIYNGLARNIHVTVGASKVSISPFSTASFDLSPDKHYRVESRTGSGELIETFDADVRGIANYVYNVAGASPLIEWTAVYGDAQQRPEMRLGAPRWGTTTADILFAKPPEKIETKSSGDTRQVLTGFGNRPPDEILELLKDPAEVDRVIAAHVRWDDPGSAYAAQWQAYAAQWQTYAGQLPKQAGASEAVRRSAKGAELHK